MSASSAASTSSAGGLYSSEPVRVRDRFEAYHSDFDPSCGVAIESAVPSLDPTTLRYGADSPHALVLRDPLVRPAYLLRPRRAAFSRLPGMPWPPAWPAGCRRATSLTVIGSSASPAAAAPALATGTRGPSPGVTAPKHHGPSERSQELWHIFAMSPRGCAAFYAGAPFAGPDRRAPPANQHDAAAHGLVIVLAALTCMPK